MVTQVQRNAAIHITRVIIFILGVISILTDSPVSEGCAIISLALWLWQPQLVRIELKLLEKYLSKRRNKWNVLFSQHYSY